jgi:uncharacterized protein (TIGR02453 family)
MAQILKSSLQFLSALKKNNNRDWFQENKLAFKEEEGKLQLFYKGVLEDLNEADSIEKMKIFRIYRDVRFSKDKTPYKTHRSVSFSRATERLRGGYYLKIAPGESMMVGGFFSPNPSDLLRIRKEFEMDDTEIRAIIAESKFQHYFNNLEGDELKSAPRGFDKNHPSIDLIRKKSFLVSKQFTDKEVLSPNFREDLKLSYLALRPFFDYMSDVLTTDINGASILK